MPIVVIAHPRSVASLSPRAHYLSPRAHYLSTRSIYLYDLFHLLRDLSVLVLTCPNARLL